ncbi:MAG: cytidine deaminase [Paludibacteraceae bacterium]|nr:cytidine deaminase [Paludibacteraceae bacterium]
MKTHTKSITYNELQENELTAEELELVNAAKEATKTSYSPYSHFAVGAAVRLSNNKTVTGSNQENGAYPSGLCAERTALFSAGALYPSETVTAIAIAAYTNGAFLESPITPCGACAQVMAEAEIRANNKPITILLYGTKGIYKLNGVSSILPFTFNL